MFLSTRTFVVCFILILAFLQVATGIPASAQSVCLPAPRLMTTMPMGIQHGKSVTVTVNGQNAEDVTGLIFSHPGLSAKPVTLESGQPVPNQFLVTAATECPRGIHEARLITRLGVSTARAFTVSEMPEVSRSTTNTSLETAMPLDVNGICNAFTTRQAIDYYKFTAKQGDRVVVECAARGIDSKLKPVVIIGDSEGADLLVERRGGILDFQVPRDSDYTIKVHDLTYQGGREYFYRLIVRKAMIGEPAVLHPATRSVSAFSWPPQGVSLDPDKGKWIPEVEPNQQNSQAQRLELPCQITGAFYPAADVDTFEFNANKGETWWVEVASERLGRPTDPSVIVQQVSLDSGEEKVTDIAELSDILSPIKVSSNGYSYDGPPYNAGSSDIIGSFTAKQDGLHRLKITDLFGGTRSDPKNQYRMIIRKAEPDFALVGWALHMNLRNGDRNALSKPVALRRGGAMILEVVAVRRDGFDGAIDLVIDDLPRGVTAAGVRIPAGQNRGYFVIAADAKAPAGFSMAKLSGKAMVEGQSVTRICQWSSMRWPVANAWSEIPSPRLMGNLPVSVTESEYAPMSLAANEDKTWEVTEGEKLTIPLVHTKRCDFSGANITLQTLGESFSKNPAFDASMSAQLTDVSLDLAKIKAKPGLYHVAFYGKAVAKYQYHPDGVSRAQQDLEAARTRLAELEQKLADSTSLSNDQAAKKKAELNPLIADAKKQVESAQKRLASATSQSQPKDIVDIYVSKPITIRVRPANKESRP